MPEPVAYVVSAWGGCVLAHAFGSLTEALLSCACDAGWQGQDVTWTPDGAGVWCGSVGGQPWYRIAAVHL